VREKWRKRHDKKPNQIRFLFFIRAVMSYLIMILLTSSAFAGSKADTGSKLEKPSTKQLLLEILYG